MPEPNTHIATGMGAAYVGAKLLGIDVDYLIVGAIGSLFAMSRQDPVPLNRDWHIVAARFAQLWGAAFNIGAVSFFAATTTSIVVHVWPDFTSVSVPIAGMVGFFGHSIIVAITEFIKRAWRVGIKRLGGSDADTN